MSRRPLLIGYGGGEIAVESQHLPGAVEGVRDQATGDHWPDRNQAVLEEHPDLFWAARGGGGNSGVVTSFVSLIDRASVRALEAGMGVPVDPLRFRANVYFDGTSSWSEHDWINSEMTFGAARLR